MLSRRIALAAVFASFILAAHVRAQAPGGNDPADPRARAPELKYESAFSGFRASKEVKPEPWKRLNEEVESLGGHMGHLKALERKTDAKSDAKPETAHSTTHKQ